MEDLIVGGEYIYSDLMNIASDKWNVKSFGDQDGIIGETFLVFKLNIDNDDPSPNVCDDAVLSFLMIDHNTQGIFRLIYKYTG